MPNLEDIKLEVLDVFRRDRWYAHDKLFPHRHPLQSSPAHADLVRRINAPRPRQLIEGFRGFAKSTYLEETAVLKAVFVEYRFLVIVGASYQMACDRLLPIKREFENNDELLSLIGDVRGPTWQEGKITLLLPARRGHTVEVAIQAMGRDQSMTGMKHGDTRPDAALIDDVEDPEEVRTDADRAATWNWFIKVFLPALSHPLYSWVRVLGTRRGVGSLPQRLEDDGWPTAKYPVEHIDDDGHRRATWPAKLTLADVDTLKTTTYRNDQHLFAQEYMCRASSESDRVFTRDMFRVEPRERVWQAVYAMIDPARTTNRTSATTGWAVWSWVANRLIVWAAGAAMLKPDEIIDLCFTIGQEYNPVWLGVEEDGLNEFILQPLRHEQARRSRTLPLKAVRAPRGKFDFIRGLQPFYAAGEVIHNAGLPDLEAQLLSFPTGRIDAPNALAYALTMRPAAPVYDLFGLSVESLVSEHDPDPSRPLYLAANATGATTTAILCQSLGGKLRIYRDWVEEGAPYETVGSIFAEASLMGDAHLVSRPRATRWIEALKLPDTSPMLKREPVRWIIPPHHGEHWNNVGLEQAIRRIPAAVSFGGLPLVGRDDLARLFKGGGPEARVSERAGWVLRGLAGGYSRALRKGGSLSEEAEQGVYRLLMEGLESFAATSAPQRVDEDADSGQPIAYNARGQAYRSILPQR